MGAVPPPEVLRAYDAVRPGLAARILSLAERHRDLAELQLAVEGRRRDRVHQATTAHLTAVHKSEQWGRWLAFGLACATLALGAGLLAGLP